MPLNMQEVREKTQKRKEYDPVPKGSHLGILVRVLDLGLQPRPPWDGEEKAPAYRIRLTFELPNVKINIDGEDKPRWIDKELNVSTFKNADMVKYYDVLDPENKHKGDWAELIGSSCAVVVVHNPGKGKHEGKIFDNVTDITPLMAGIPVPELENEPVVFDLGSPSVDIFNALPEFIQNKIKSNLEYSGSKLQKLLTGDNITPTASTPDLDKEADTEEDADGNDNPW